MKTIGPAHHRTIPVQIHTLIAVGENIVHQLHYGSSSLLIYPVVVVVGIPSLVELSANRCVGEFCIV